MNIKKHLGKIYLCIVIIAYIWANWYIDSNITIGFMREHAYRIINPLSLFNFFMGIIWTVSEILVHRK